MKYIASLAFWFFFIFDGMAQIASDSLFLMDGTILIGKIKSMERGDLNIDVPFSENNIKVKWDLISKMVTNQKFLLSTNSGEHYEADFLRFENDELDILISNPSKRQSNKMNLSKGDTLHLKPNEVLQFYEISQDFISRMSGEISLGFNLARSNKLRQYSFRGFATYNANSWALFGTMNFIQSRQEQANPIERFDSGITGLIYLPKEWYVMAWVNFLKNNQQLLELRIDSKVGFGKFLINQSKSMWMVQTGLNFNNEEFMNELPPNSSLEGVLSTSLSFYDVEGFDILFNMIFYESFSEKDRIRSDFRIDLKYDFYKDFFVKIGSSFNYDSKPTTGATPLDYVIQSTLGWNF
ncbi:DUF481 domain-containing protein [Algoriphagus zhangzhouensis]|uniref:Salt-induced outer membrane protein YdiY n=1 Tax=Algoriphagus zhangzhouensis TaxID=1073327 RepID=A0A1M7ZKJ2_9BACT|nr:DUF481 domain-containing protein [Algoriphagus zhangzhouensis]TDY42633.1 uncharacterized protein DUF481 [Algoriphagus zhangzhouensis]SHO65414.1 Protein of unknown function, DUF481 [Algoriphagus zhangzhouensis]